MKTKVIIIITRLNRRLKYLVRVRICFQLPLKLVILVKFVLWSVSKVSPTVLFQMNIPDSLDMLFVGIGRRIQARPAM